jgi:hypothetical protein
MARLIRVPRHDDDRGSLSVVDGLLPFPVRRVFYIRRVPAGAERAGHRHLRNRIGLACLSGGCEAVVDPGGGGEVRTFPLADPDEILLLEPGEWHLLRRFEAGTVLLCLASDPYDPSDYAQEPLP